jgi:uncharacterized protein (TIGR02594 family)
MKFVARAALGLVLIAMAAPTAALADVMDFYNQPEVRKAMRTKGVPQLSKALATTRPLRAKRQASTVGPAAAVKPSRSLVPTFAAASNPRWISVAQQYKGTNPTGRKSLWCADFLNLVLTRSGMQGTSSSMAKSFASYGQRLPGPKVGAIAVISRGKTAGHVGIVTGIDAGGNPILISGNHNNTVAEATYSRGRVIAYVWPVG